MTVAFMRSVVVFFVGVVACGIDSPLAAQEPPPRIPRLVVDGHGTVASFPDSLQLAQSRRLTQAELPGLGVGGAAGVHVYPFKWRAITVGLGGHVSLVRAHRTHDDVVQGQTPLRPVTERFTSVAPELSFNFGSGNGWSYLSGGIASANWSIVPDGGVALASDDERLKAITYGGGARWFAKPHLAFSFDLRFYMINPSAPNGPLPSSLRTTLMVIGAGVSVK